MGGRIYACAGRCGQPMVELARFRGYLEAWDGGVRGTELRVAFTHEPVERVRCSAEAKRLVEAALRRVATRSAPILTVVALGSGAITSKRRIGGRDVVARRMTGGEL